jgi:FMN phosphatase YigB (HAD superfamily)
VGVAGNQPIGVEAQLHELGFEADFIASSATWGVAKSSANFFSRVVQTTRLDASAIPYVGERLDNDILPARAADMRTAFLRRGPWGYLHAQRPEVDLADMRPASLPRMS